MAGALVHGRNALERQAWGDAYAAFEAADSDGTLGPEDLEAAALAAYLTGRDEQSESLWTRAFRAWRDRGDPRRAARCAFWLGFPLLLSARTARGGGWLARGARLLEGLADDCAERGLLLVPEGLRALTGGDPLNAGKTFARIEEIGESSGDPNVLAFGRLGGGQALIALGNVAEGVGRLDEAMVAVTADDVSPIATGIVYCAVLLACQETFDVARAEEWTASLSRWSAAQQDLVPFRGECLVHRAEVMQSRGQWFEALVEARRACDWLAGRPAVARAHYRLGELHRLRGEAAEADGAFRAASAAGRQPQPGCALLRLAQGRLETAGTMIESALEAATTDVAKARVLPAAIEVAVARGQVAAARSAVEELSRIAGDADAPVLQAIAAHAQGVVLLSDGDPRRALAVLQETAPRWHELSLPYEAARGRVAIALACRELGDGATASMELAAARGTFAELGAAPDLERVDRLGQRGTRASAVGLTNRELEVLELVAGGKTNKQIAAALILSPHTIRRHLQNIFRKTGVTSRAAATAFALQHELIEGAAWHEETTRPTNHLARKADARGPSPS